MALNRQLNKAIINSLSGKYAVYIVQLMSLALLARLFSPEEFGFIASIQVFAMFFQMLATSGLAPAVVYQQSFGENQRDGVFTFTVILGLFLAIIFIILAPYIHSWYEYERGLELFFVLGACVLFASVSMIPQAALQKDAKFLLIARCELLAELFSLVLCLCLYFQQGGLIALASKFVSVPILRFIFYWYASKKTSIGQPKIGREISAVYDLLGFAKYQVGFNVLNYFSRNLDNVLIAKYFGVSALGFYEKTYQVMRYPLQLFTFAITPALQPVLTRYRDDPDLVCKEYYRVAYRLALVGLFSSIVLYWGAEPLIYILFGEKWLQAADFLRVLSISIPIQMVMSSTGGVYQAFGATRAMFACGLFSSFVNVTAILLGVLSGDLLVLCLALCLAFSINFLQCFWVLHRKVFLSSPLNAWFLCLLVYSAWANIILFNVAPFTTINILYSIYSLSTIILVSLGVCLGLYYLIRRRI